ncbi:ATP-binding cassette domain-containing protein [Nocardioides carbamazepini]|uniref:ABC transporter ATP-binding protein n=1 Tax=Nocardioides carbamazepini TaxID=2854259 RepID=UPI00214A1E07|nr:ATP-binding cassette domain-containing protein [Nocardioides carbamazepini]MCR1785847.1 ATP-binding cassette domain-containing protein [Nocardioides carbamazepini]
MSTTTIRAGRLTSVAAEGLSRHFGRGAERFTAVAELDLEIPVGRRIGIVGESGSGKSTLARMIAGLDEPDEGDVVVDGRPLRQVLRSRSQRVEYRRVVQLVAQDSMSSFDPLRTVRDAVRTPAEQLCGLGRAAADALADETVSALGLSPDLLDRRPHELSGGQRQRCSLARAMVVQPRLIVCDEVVSALDVSVQGQVLNLIKDYCERTGAALAFVSHGLPATAFVAEELVVMRHGRIVERGTCDEVLTAPAHPYTRQLVAAFRGRGAGSAA